jgi:5-methylcytosine-specific restriction enzyme subunit McrC
MNRIGPQLPTFELGEWESRLIEDEILTPADQRLRQELEAGEEGRLLVDELRRGVRITARSWVGVVRFERFEVRVVPKLAGDNLGLLAMIEFATGLDALRRASSARTLQAEGAGLMDLLALLLAEASEAILRGGILGDYVEREEDLPVLRGRLLGDLQVLRRFGQVDRLVCRFDEHEQDIVENQLLAAALGRCSTRVTHESVRRRVRRLLAIFQEVCRTDALDLDGLRHRGISYHRLNDHYRNAHALAWLLLDGLGTRDLLASGGTQCFAFLIDMNRLFEKFVFRLVDRLLAGIGVRVHYQRGDRSIIVNASTNQSYARVVPDFLIEATDPTVAARVAVDAKYKLYDERKLDSGDVYQGFLYAYAFGGAGRRVLPAALLLYPSSTRSSQAVRLRVRSAQTSGDAEILALGFSIPEALAEVSHRAQGPVTRAIIEAIQQGIGWGPADRRIEGCTIERVSYSSVEAPEAR